MRKLGIPQPRSPRSHGASRERYNKSPVVTSKQTRRCCRVFSFCVGLTIMCLVMKPKCFIYFANFFTASLAVKAFRARSATKKHRQPSSVDFAFWLFADRQDLFLQVTEVEIVLSSFSWLLLCGHLGTSYDLHLRNITVTWSLVRTPDSRDPFMAAMFLLVF